MTLTAEDRKRASDDASPFSVQEKLQHDLANVIRNMLMELTNRPQVPNQVMLSEHVINDICDVNEMGCCSLHIDNKLTAELSDFSFEANAKSGLDISDLAERVEKPRYSYPAVSISLSRYNPKSYEVQSDEKRNTRDLRVLVMAVNHSEVLIYDPLKYAIRDEPGSINPTEVSKRDFVDAWKGRLETTDTLWVEETDQSRITEWQS